MNHEHAHPVGTGDYVVREGDDVHSIAHRHGVRADAIWEHPDNRDLREARTPEMLLPGDRVTLPEEARSRPPRVEPGASHHFSADVPPHEIRIQLRSGGRAHPEERYTAEVDGRTHEGVIGGDGIVTVPVRPSTRVVVLTIHEQWDGFEHDHVIHVRVGGLDPSAAATGIQARLSHLGFHPGPVDGDVGPRTRDAIRRFQAQHDLDISGDVDDATRQRIVDEHGH